MIRHTPLQPLQNITSVKMTQPPLLIEQPRKATDALERLSKKRRLSRKSTPPQHCGLSRPRSHHDSLFAMMFSTLPPPTDSDDSCSLPFPVIRWEDDDDEYDCSSSSSSDSLRDDDFVKLLAMTYYCPNPNSAGTQSSTKRKRCLRRCLTCLDHLSTLALDELASRDENDDDEGADKTDEQAARHLRKLTL